MITNKVKMEFLQEWLFHYNPYKGLWHAFKREDKDAYFNGQLKEVMSAEKHSDLVKYLLLKDRGIIVES